MAAAGRAISQRARRAGDALVTVRLPIHEFWRPRPDLGYPDRSRAWLKVRQSWVPRITNGLDQSVSNLSCPQQTRARRSRPTGSARRGRPATCGVRAAGATIRERPARCFYTRNTPRKRALSASPPWPLLREDQGKGAPCQPAGPLPCPSSIRPRAGRQLDDKPTASGRQ
jgi:hypothetical protein